MTQLTSNKAKQRNAAQFRNRKSKEYAQLLRAVQDLRSVVDVLAQSKLAESEAEERRAVRLRPVLLLGLLCGVFLVLAGFLTYFGAEVSANPVAEPTGVNSIALAVQTRPAASIPAYISATFTQDVGDNANYQVTVPAKYAGDRFVLLLLGTARIDRPAFSIWGQSLQSRSFGCRDLRSDQVTQGGWVIPGGTAVSSEPCQLITGRFPAEASVHVATSCGRGAGESPGGWMDDAVQIDVSGSSHTATALNWAYEQYSLPDDANEVPPGTYLDTWNSASLGGWYTTTSTPSACWIDELPKNAELTDISQPATQSANGTLLWTGPRIDTDALVVRQRDADEMGNALLAAGAATAALAIGLIPVFIDAYRERRRGLRRSR